MDGKLKTTASEREKVKKSQVNLKGFSIEVRFQFQKIKCPFLYVSSPLRF